MSTNGIHMAVAELLSFSRALPNRRLISSCRRSIMPQGSCRITELMAPLLVWQEDHGRNSLAWLEPGDCRVARVGAKFFKTPLPVFKVAVSGQADAEKRRSSCAGHPEPASSGGFECADGGLGAGLAFPIHADLVADLVL